MQLFEIFLNFLFKYNVHAEKSTFSLLNSPKLCPPGQSAPHLWSLGGHLCPATSLQPPLLKTKGTYCPDSPEHRQV